MVGNFNKISRYPLILLALSKFQCYISFFFDRNCCEMESLSLEGRRIFCQKLCKRLVFHGRSTIHSLLRIFQIFSICKFSIKQNNIKLQSTKNISQEYSYAKKHKIPNYLLKFYRNKPRKEHLLLQFRMISNKNCLLFYYI